MGVVAGDTQIGVIWNAQAQENQSIVVWRVALWMNPKVY